MSGLRALTYISCLLCFLLVPVSSVMGAENSSWKIFPRGDLFQPLIVDPKQPMFKMSVWAVSTSIRDTVLGLATLGESFGIVQRSDPDLSRGFQIDLAGGVFAQFDLLRESADLVNTDFVVSLPITMRHQEFSLRFRPHHQSSHLGDEFLLNNSLARLNFSYEAIEILAAYDKAAWRLYGGGEVMWRHEPSNLDPAAIHLGLEYRRQSPWFLFADSKGAAIPLAGLDLKLWQYDDFSPSVSFKAGLEFVASDDQLRKHRAVRVVLEFYHGISPFGQFFADQVDITGGGFGFQLAL